MFSSLRWQKRLRSVSPPSEHFCGQRNATLGVQVKIWLRLVENGKFLSQQGRRKAISR
uniref:Uncharacterized protein n=1 Tax=Anguilla anguilla TaxID=7936 RepID=A0A0E9SI98_ANGAN